MYNMKPFRFWCNKILPLTYDNSLSYYQLLCKVVKHLNMLVENNNDIIEDFKTLYNEFVKLKDYVEDYLRDLDVTEAINNKLDEMVSDGTLGNLLNKLYLETPINLSVDFSPVFSLRKVRGIDRRDLSTSEQKQCYGVTQGGAYGVYNNTPYYCVGSIPTNGSNNTGFRIELIDMNRKSIEVFYKTDDNTHLNSMFYFNGSFYFPTLNFGYIARFDLVDRSFYLTPLRNAPEYFNRNEIGVCCYCEYDNKFYFGNNYTLYEFVYDGDLNAFIYNNKTITVEQSPYGINQSIDVNKYGFIRVVSNPNTIIYHNKDGSINKYINIPEYIDGGSFFAGAESEDITVDDDFNVITHLTGIECANGIDSYTRVIKTNLLKNVRCGVDVNTATSKVNNGGSASPLQTQSVYVDNSTGIYPSNSNMVEMEYYFNSSNPEYIDRYSHGTGQNPYAFLQSGLNKCCGNTLSKGCFVFVSGDKPYTVNSLYNLNNVNIVGDTTNKPVFTNLVVSNCNKLQISNIIFTNINARENSAVRINNSYLIVGDIDFNSNFNIGLDCSTSTLECRGAPNQKEFILVQINNNSTWVGWEQYAVYFNVTGRNVNCGKRILLPWSADLAKVNETGFPVNIMRNLITNSRYQEMVIESNRVITFRGYSTISNNISHSYYYNGKLYSFTINLEGDYASINIGDNTTNEISFIY